MLAPVSHELPPGAHGVRRVDFRALGTHCSLQFRHRDDRAALTFAADSLTWLGEFEAKFSRFRASSLVSRINASAGRDWVETDVEMERMLDLAEGVYNLSSGILDATMLPLLRLWDWKKAHPSLPSPGEVEEALFLTGWHKVQRRPRKVFLPQAGMGLDFGGFGKEFAVDRLAQLAMSRGIKDALIDLGRDIFALGGNGVHPFWHVGLEDARQPGQCHRGIALSERAVSASGDHARCFVHEGRRYGHIVDPRTGWPVANGVRSCNVIAASCLEAGVYSTAICVLGAHEGLRFASGARGVEAIVQTDTGSLTSKNFTRWEVRAA
jgi:thiamine biosynthesis lipoprotein